jgi:hypothetical protein
MQNIWTRRARCDPRRCGPLATSDVARPEVLEVLEQHAEERNAAQHVDRRVALRGRGRRQRHGRILASTPRPGPARGSEADRTLGRPIRGARSPPHGHPWARLRALALCVSARVDVDAGDRRPARRPFLVRRRHAARGERGREELPRRRARPLARLRAPPLDRLRPRPSASTRDKAERYRRRPPHEVGARRSELYSEGRQLACHQLGIPGLQTSVSRVGRPSAAARASASGRAAHRAAALDDVPRGAGSAGGPRRPSAGPPPRDPAEAAGPAGHPPGCAATGIDCPS